MNNSHNIKMVRVLSRPHLRLFKSSPYVPNNSSELGRNTECSLELGNINFASTAKRTSTSLMDGLRLRSCEEELKSTRGHWTDKPSHTAIRGNPRHRGLVILYPKGCPPGEGMVFDKTHESCLLYTSPSPRDLSTSRMPSSA